MYALVDCNNFFVSCERVFRPELEGKAVVVLSNNDGCVVSRSNESKALGIKMCTPFYQIRHLVEEGVLTACSSNYTLYGDLSARVMSVLSEADPEIEIYSIDEAFLNLQGMPAESVRQYCSNLVVKVRKWVGIPVSIGVAPTRTLAKIASHFAKKWKAYNGVCMMETEEKRLKALSMTPVSEVWGIGRQFSSKLEYFGVKTALDFSNRPEAWVRKHFLLPGVRTWKELAGKDCIEKDHADKRKTICTSRSFADMLESEDKLAGMVSEFAVRCAEKLRAECSAAQEVTVFLLTNRFRTDLPQYCPSETSVLNVASNSSLDIVSEALKILSRIYRSGYMYKKAGVIVSSIVDQDAVQLPLFGCDMDKRCKNEKLSRVIDFMNRKDRDILRLASQGDGRYADGIRSEFRSRAYSTSFEDIIEVH